MLRSLLLAIVLASVASCGSDSNDLPAAVDTGESIDIGADATIPQLDATAQPDADSHDMGTDVQSMPDASQDADMDTEPPAPRLALLADRHWVGLDIQNDSVGFECLYLDEGGAVLDPPEDLEISVDGDEATAGPEGRWTFSDYGVFTARCSSQSLGLTTEEEIVANFDPVDWRFYETSRLLDEAAQYHEDALMAYATGDTTVHAEAVEELEYIVATMPELDDVDWIADHPTDAWPGASEFDAAGLPTDSDDALWQTAIDDLETTAVAERDAWDALDVATASDADLANFQALRADTQAALAALPQVSSQTAWLDRERAGDAFRALLKAGQLSNEKLLEFYKTNTPTPPQPGGLSLVEVMVTIGIQVAVEEVSSRVGGYSYNKMLKSAATQVVASLVGIAIKDLLNLIITPAPNAPELDSVHGSAAGFVASGNPFIAYGTFPDGPTRNLIVFIPPRIAHLLVSVLDKINSVKSAVNSARLAVKTQEIARAVTAIYKLRGMIDAFGDVEEAQTHIVFTPASGDAMFLNYPEIPPKVNCNMLGLPVTGTMLPVHLVHGPGEAINVNVLGERCSY